MTLTQSERDARRRRRRRDDLARWGVRLLLVVIVFGLGIAVGLALHDNPQPGGTVSFQQTVSVPSGPPGSTVKP